MIISNIKVYDNLSNEDVFNLACKKNKIDISKVVEWHILKKSVDARKKDDIHFSYSEFKK